MTSLWILAIAALVFVGCSGPTVVTYTTAPSSSTCSAIASGSELSYCSNVIVPSVPVTITGTAIYKKRSLDSTCGGLGYACLGAVDVANYPIRRAEIRILDSAGNVVQCGETDNSGNFSIQVQQSGSPLTLQVNSRGYNSYVKASVLDRKEHNQLYSISTSFVPSGNTNIGTLTASAIGSLEGGGFHIFDQILKANEFLASQTTNCNASFADCAPYSATYKVYAYWTPGFNPGCYYGSSSGISYYLPGQDQLFILGGLSGDVDNTDTDHFDPSVITHEYGHFIEDHYAKTDSPGGSHDANSVIDPRLAWGEGWANFFSIAVSGSPTYTDTYGNISGSSKGVYFNHNLETNAPKRDPKEVAYTVPSGEGNFREFGITRALLRAVKGSAGLPPDTLANSGGATFKEFWTIFAGSNGIKNASNSFRNFGLFTQLHAALVGATNLSTVWTAEKQKPNLSDYNNPGGLGGCGTTRTIAAANTNNWNEDGSFAHSSQFASNDFYYYNHAGGALNVTLTRTSGAADLDLYIYKDSYTYGNSSSMAAYSNGSGATESVSVSLPAGRYMINVMVFTGSGLGGSTNYTLNVNGSNLCM